MSPLAPTVDTPCTAGWSTVDTVLYTGAGFVAAAWLITTFAVAVLVLVFTLLLTGAGLELGAGVYVGCGVYVGLGV